MRSRGIKVLRLSSVYETDAVGPPQPDFLNAAAEIETTLPAGDLLAELKQIERSIGRRHRERWGPREIDLDLLLYDDQVIEDSNLTIPHPEITRRAFVMIPLLEIDPGLELPTGEPLSVYCEPDSPGVRILGRMD